MYKQDTGLTIICRVKKARALFCENKFNMQVQILFQADLKHEYTVTNNLHIQVRPKTGIFTPISKMKQKLCLYIKEL